MVLARVALTSAFFTLTQTAASPPAVVGGAFDAGGVELAYTIAGDGPPVILLHSFTGSTQRDWIAPGVMARLSKSFRVIAVDARGHGRSGKPHFPEEYGTEMIGDVARLMDHLGLERAHVVGSSMGGFTAIKFAAIHPARVMSLFTVGAGWLNAEWQTIGGEWTAFAEQLETGQADVGENDPRALAAVLRGAEGFLVEEASLRSITMPYLAVMGENDSFRPLLEALIAVVPRVDVELLPGRDHDTAESDPRFQPLLESFLANHKGRGTH